MAEACGVHVETLEFGLTAPVEPTALAARLNRDPDHRIRAVLVDGHCHFCRHRHRGATAGDR
jgi:aspartate aminotransferase-like enzyme